MEFQVLLRVKWEGASEWRREMRRERVGRRRVLCWVSGVSVLEKMACDRLEGRRVGESERVNGDENVCMLY